MTKKLIDLMSESLNGVQFVASQDNNSHKGQTYKILSFIGGDPFDVCIKYSDEQVFTYDPNYLVNDPVAAEQIPKNN